MTNWTKRYTCNWLETAYALAKGDIFKEYEVEVYPADMEAVVVGTGVIEVRVRLGLIMEMQMCQAQQRLNESLAAHHARFVAADEAKKHRAHLRSQAARVIVSDTKVTHYGKDRRQYLAEVELDGARITAHVAGVNLTPAQHAAFKKALTTALHEGIIAESEKK